MQTACGIEDNNIIAVILGVLHSLLGNDNGIYLSHLEHLYACLVAYYLELIDSRRTVNVTGCQQGSLAHFLEMLGKLCCVGSFTRALETHHHNDAGSL